ncbi:DUF2207 domain-containing protein [Citrobacter amalonaticus]|uniref:DUF2207 domain-containing protein n=1 Tax=Citrobacter amalonaticus TaxID=35703 RepID=A0A2S4RUX9_CITAM|nr:DUF2207 domain-containing protein [Citrobacter amalonaticus]POT55463.1 DUF2207 domain-containing protein [Citrobacter amalonaticus]POT73674.1 DUF2207 domain-containing protein [Citrobacter amalonaticus]POU63899.1 DUF2207 domain-containing protein [Citrobacter amalonaticus]POV03532.1 DUF2207 domain-containing protein [Citrobacter amalonaticus]
MPTLSARLLRGFGLLFLLLVGFSSVASDDIIITDASQLPPNARLVPAYEHIISFDSRARFNPDGSMEMQENITVLSLGNEIRRGIFRTLPLTWNRQDGKIFSVDYAIKSVLRDGSAEPYSLDQATKTLTVRIGSAGQILKPGIYHYEIRYQVSNHFSRFPEWDELYWNVTGNDWSWPVSKARFHLELPDAIANLNGEGKDARLRTIDVYTGVPGAKDHNAIILPDGSIQTSRPLATGEGLTVVYTWPRDILANAAAPEAVLPLVHLLMPTLATSLIWLPLLLLIAYWWLWWRKNVTATGLKMPPVVPQFSLPDTMSPGYLRFIMQRKYDDVAFSSDLLGLVAKRAMTLTKKKSKTKSIWLSPSVDEQWLSRSPDEKNPRLNAADKKLLSILFSGKRKNINLSQPHQPLMRNARNWLDKRCQQQKPQLCRKWGKPFRRCIYIALLVPVVCGVWFSPAAALLTIPCLIFGSVGVSLLLFLLKFLRHPIKTWRSWGFLPLLMALIFGPFATLAGGAFLFGMLPLTQLPAGYVGALWTAIVLCALVGWKTPRYTQSGLNDLAIAKGLKLYIKTAEKPRFQALYPPAQGVAHFESLLPVALALDVGKTWANTFARYLVSTGAMSEAFDNADWASVNHFCHGCHSASSQKPGQSSGSGGSSGSGYRGSGSSGGGSSGGGSGGGGGGGW